MKVDKVDGRRKAETQDVLIDAISKERGIMKQKKSSAKEIKILFGASTLNTKLHNQIFTCLNIL